MRKTLWLSGEHDMTLKHLLSDLHLHLNGSFSLAFLEQMARENGAEAQASFAALLKLRTPPATETAAEREQRLWQQFPLIHRIVNRVENLVAGTVDVVATSQAHYLEIRTAPKGADAAARKSYIDFFVHGLQQANRKFSGQKIAFGLLSLDRSTCTPQIAYELIEAARTEKETSGLLLGLDLSGPYQAPRTLTGTDLSELIAAILSSTLGLALHVGEIDSPEERKDLDLILETLAAWRYKQEPTAQNPFHGKLRLGHGIFLTPQHIKHIQAMQLPIEVCPACHEHLNWWKKDRPHPVQAIYSSWLDPVVTGTDDVLLFGEDANTANQRILELLAYPKDQEKDQARAHQAQFRFSKQS